MAEFMDNMAIKQKLSTQELILVQSEVAKYKKSMGVAYLLNIFLWALGAHRFYLGKPVSACFMIILTIFTLGIFSGIWAFIDLFLIPSMIHTTTDELERTALLRVYNNKSFHEETKAE
ncbi:TM2 domain-containing protein [Bacillus cereus]|uniref:TM2 domain-containing protein n=1 Tax=Bacillus TaxID=1386 RepID=UPI0018F796A4|nr:TM2 domain-containing protein [Bacillus cereus]MDM5375439.1 TM2 domain-containing protein [Bacillus bombysepticus]MBJ7951400.1 TM2 domain-containing protein [Bacillus cereus]MDF9519543.1 TM2 domain-containing protein [Bacillus cereus]MDF9562854.1 TM2 domain-containing protein [Bacillus cereus]MDZ4452961.1 TM2 domain-containing protein [Bacillus cereus]